MMADPYVRQTSTWFLLNPLMNPYLQSPTWVATQVTSSFFVLLILGQIASRTTLQCVMAVCTKVCKLYILI